ncbi:unnamed protein product [Schistocephalus solidus]|uniref:Reverse transcriptase domain-containing protein n=1 Tax=Schistocephalus solidus TaxID=70667 RepID=A0A183SFW5_SCHSO|nr:unnamed protein product [Schistocephalus solidus]
MVDFHKFRIRWNDLQANYSKYAFDSRLLMKTIVSLLTKHVCVPIRALGGQQAAPIVAIKKTFSKVRICAGFSTGLNAALDTHQHPRPVPDNHFAKLNYGTCFAKLDLSDAYVQIEVPEESREPLLINTRRGLFPFTRLPFGVKTSPAIFEQTMDIRLMGTEGAVA